MEPETAASAEQFIRLIERSGLVEQRDLDTALSGFNIADTEIEDLSQALVGKGLLTDWQLDKLRKGRWKGFQLGKYRLLGVLGQGGMGIVYLGRHLTLRNNVAIKVFPRTEIGRGKALDRFYREARTAAQLNHQNVTRTFDVDQEGTVHYIVMEFVQGRSLEDLVRADGPLSYEKAAEYIRQACDGLAHAHNMGLVHRDIKPSNLMLDESGTVKILDFGLARVLDDEDEAALTTDGSQGMGTADYLSPEQALDSHNVDHRADLYSLGHTLYFLLTGSAPFPKGNKVERVLRHCKFQPDPISKFRPDVPDGLVNIFRHMTKKNRDKRYGSAAEIAKDLKKWLDGDLDREPDDSEDSGVNLEMARWTDQGSKSGDSTSKKSKASSSPSLREGRAKRGEGGGDVANEQDALWDDLLDGSAQDTNPSGVTNWNLALPVGAGTGSNPAGLSSPGMTSPPSMTQATGMAGPAPAPSVTGVTKGRAKGAEATPGTSVVSVTGAGTWTPQQPEPTKKKSIRSYKVGEYPLWLCITAGGILGGAILLIGISIYNWSRNTDNFSKGLFGDTIEVEDKRGHKHAVKANTESEG